MSSVASYLINRVNNEIPTNDDKLISIGGLTAFADNIVNTTHSAQATEYYVEDGSNVSDTIIQMPKEIEIDGYISDSLLYRKNPTVFSRVTGDGLAIISKYTNNKTQAQINKALAFGQSLSDIYSQYDQLVRDGLSILEIFERNTKDKYVDKFYSEIRRLQSTGQLIKVKTKNTSYESMAIESFNFIQDYNNINSASFSISLKQVRLVSSRQSDKSDMIGKNTAKTIADQVSTKSSEGVQTGTKIPVEEISNNAIFNSSLEKLINNKETFLFQGSL